MVFHPARLDQASSRGRKDTSNKSESISALEVVQDGKISQNSKQIWRLAVIFMEHWINYIVLFIQQNPPQMTKKTLVGELRGEGELDTIHRARWNVVKEENSDKIHLSLLKLYRSGCSFLLAMLGPCHFTDW